MLKAYFENILIFLDGVQTTSSLRGTRHHSQESPSLKRRDDTVVKKRPPIQFVDTISGEKLEDRLRTELKVHEKGSSSKRYTFGKYSTSTFPYILRVVSNFIYH